MAMFLAGLEPWCWNPAGGQRTVGRGFGISIREVGLFVDKTGELCSRLKGRTRE